MKLFKKTVWSVMDIGSLKLCCIALGMIIGAYLPEFTRRYFWAFIFAVILLAIKPVITYFGSEKQG